MFDLDTFEDDNPKDRRSEVDKHVDSQGDDGNLLWHIYYCSREGCTGYRYLHAESYSVRESYNVGCEECWRHNVKASMFRHEPRHCAGCVGQRLRMWKGWS